MWVVRINAILILLLIFTISLALIPAQNLSEPNVEFLPDMAHSVAYDAYAPNPNFKDGMTLRQPPEGTIPRGALPQYKYEATEEGAKKAGRELSSPLQGDDPLVLERGANGFANFCMPCHGASGMGDGPITKRGYPPPPTILAGDPVTRNDGEYFHVITYGQGNMPGYAPQMSAKERWEVIHYVRSMQKKEKAKKK